MKLLDLELYLYNTLPRQLVNRVEYARRLKCSYHHYMFSIDDLLKLVNADMIVILNFMRSYVTV